MARVTRLVDWVYTLPERGRQVLVQEQADRQQRADATAQARALDRAASLAHDAAGRLATLSPDERSEVVRLLDIEVVTMDASRTPALQIRGTVCDLGLTTGCDSGNGDPSSIEA